MYKAYIIWPLMALGMAACVSAANYEAPAPKQGLSPTEIVAARQAAYALSAATFGNIRTIVTTDLSVKGLAYSSGALARWAQTLPSMFPDSTAGISVDAKPEIWTNRADFDARAAAYAQAATRLAELAKAGDKLAFVEQVKVVKAACDACHSVYKKED